MFWIKPTRFLSDFFDAELQVDSSKDGDARPEGGSILVSLPMQLFSFEKPEIQAKIVCKPDKCIIYDTTFSLPVKEVEAPPLDSSDSHDQLYELVERYYVAIGKLIVSKEATPFLVRDFAYPPYDARHWGKGNPIDITTSNGCFEYEAIADFQADNEYYLSIREGEVLQLVDDLKDGRYLMRSKTTRMQGAVPENYLKLR